MVKQKTVCEFRCALCVGKQAWSFPCVRLHHVRVSHEAFREGCGISATHSVLNILVRHRTCHQRWGIGVSSLQHSCIFQIRAVTAHTSYGNWWHNSCLQLEDSCWWGIFFGIWLLKHRICGIFGWIQPHYAQGFSPPARVCVGHPGVAWICIYRNTQIR